MLFHTSLFLFVFLPLTLATYFVLGRWSWHAAIGSLTLASLIFYGAWAPVYVLLIGGSICVNYAGSLLIDALRKHRRMPQARWALAAFIAFDLALLCYFKYLNFFVSQVEAALGDSWHVAHIVLPIGISFYTFTQIAYLVDTFRDDVSERTFMTYVLFVTYFPHLVAGPVLHHSEMMPQFADRTNLRFDPRNVAAGLTFLAFGLFKKIVLADGLAPLANATFAAPAGTLSPGDAWLGALAYTLQLYFDFSGYSDMAVGVSLMFNIRLPINFFSPYRAGSIIDFWRRWHMTLSRFLRDYLYFPLGGNRKGEGRRNANLVVTMALGGLWHGANWTFVAWGLVHALYIVINHQWRRAWMRMRGAAPDPIWLRPAGWALTFLAVVVAWVFFRAPDIGSAVSYVGNMFGRVPASTTLVATSGATLGLLAAGLGIAWFMPNSNEVMDYRFGDEGLVSKPRRRSRWSPRGAWGVAVGAMLLVTLVVGVTSRDKLEFLYFQF